MTESAAQRLAQGFVEGATEYDFAELPASLQADLVACAVRFLMFAQPQVVAGEVGAGEVGAGEVGAGEVGAGAWMVYEHDRSPYAISLHASAADAARKAARQGYGKVGFWPFQAELSEAVDLWERGPDGG